MKLRTSYLCFWNWTWFVHFGLFIYCIRDTLAWATGTQVGTGDHAMALFCIEYGCVLGLYSDKLHFEVLMCALLNFFYICGCDVAYFVILWVNSALPCCVSVSCSESR